MSHLRLHAPTPPAWLGQLLADLEVPDDCDCDTETERGSPLAACPCILARDHDHTLAEWAELQRLGNAAEYADAPLPGGPTLALPGTPAKIEVMAARVAQGRACGHPGDLRPDQVTDQAARRVRRGRNGAALAGDLDLAQRRAA